jgi:hypothetical protein
MVAAGANYNMIAQALQSGVYDAMTVGALQYSPSNSDRAAYFKRLAKAAKEFLELLDERDDVRTLVNDTKIAGGLTGNGAGLRQLFSEAISLPKQWYPEGVPIVSVGTGIPTGLGQDVVFQQLELAPRAAAIVLILAEHASRFRQVGASDAGRKRDEGSNALFKHLASIYFAMFGKMPAIGSERTDPNEPSYRWITAVLSLLGERALLIRETRLSPRHPSARNELELHIAVIQKANALSPVTKADYLAEGWHHWSDQPLEQKWLTSYWWPFGTDVPNMSGVPEWLLAKAIPTPQ